MEEKIVGSTQTHTFLNPLGPETSPFSIPFPPEEALNSGRVKELRPQGFPPSKQGMLNSWPLKREMWFRDSSEPGRDLR